MFHRIICSPSCLQADAIVRTTFVLLSQPHAYALPLGAAPSGFRGRRGVL